MWRNQVSWRADLFFSYRSLMPLTRILFTGLQCTQKQDLWITYQFYFNISKGISTLFSIMVILVWILTNSTGGFPLLYILSRMYCLQIFDDGHSDWCELIPHCTFALHFSNNQQCRASYHVPIHQLLFMQTIFIVSYFNKWITMSVSA